MIYILIATLIGLTSIGISLYIRYKLEKDIIVKYLNEEHNKKIW